MSVSSACVGLFSGAMFFIAFFLAPYWSGLDPNEFRTWFTVHGPAVGTVMLTGGVTTLAVAIAAMVANPHQKFLRYVVVSLFALAIVYVTGNEPINGIIQGQDSLSPLQITQLLDRWKVLHGVRAYLGLQALVFSYIAIRKG